MSMPTLISDITFHISLKVTLFSPTPFPSTTPENESREKKTDNKNRINFWSIMLFFRLKILNKEYPLITFFWSYNIILMTQGRKKLPHENKQIVL